MTNREKFGEKILDLMSNSNAIAIDKETNEPVKCAGFSCHKCVLNADCTPESFASWLNAKYVEPQIDWSKVAVDTPILVKNYETHEWKKRYFAKCEDGRIFAFANGATRWSNDDGDIYSWQFGKLAEVDNG